MGIPERHPGSPYVDDEILDGTDDLEIDVERLIRELNGNLENVNFRDGAQIRGTKLRNDTLTAVKITNASIDAGAKLMPQTVAAAQVEDNGVPSSAIGPSPTLTQPEFVSFGSQENVLPGGRGRVNVKTGVSTERVLLLFSAFWTRFDRDTVQTARDVIIRVLRDDLVNPLQEMTTPINIIGGGLQAQFVDENPRPNTTHEYEFEVEVSPQTTSYGLRGARILAIELRR